MQNTHGAFEFFAGRRLCREQLKWAMREINRVFDVIIILRDFNFVTLKCLRFSG